jgi:hypothetical protein
MIKRAILCVAGVICVIVIALIGTGCGWFDSNPAVPEDGDAGGDGDVGVDDVPAEEAPDDRQDPPADQADGQEDPGEDVPGEELAPDEGEIVPDLGETVPDVEPDIGDVVEEDAVSPCLPLEGTIGGVDSWTDGMTNTTIATFNLALSNNNRADSACIFSEITLVEGTLRGAADDSLILTYDTVGPTGPIADLLSPGMGVLANLRAACSRCTAPCDIQVIVEVTIEYMIDGLAAPPVRIESASVQHICVY